MNKIKTGSFLLFTLLFSLSFTSVAKAEPSRRDLKRMCRAQYKECRKSESRKSCRKKKKQCRKDNGVTFKDDLKNLRDKLLGGARKVAGVVDITLGEDENKGEFIQVSIISKFEADMGDIYYQPNNFDSIISFEDRGEEKVFSLKVFTSDLENRGIGEELQTSEGRLFPKFINGQKYESLYGEPIKMKNGKYAHIYFDGEKKVFGFFIPSPHVGKGISKLNELKNKSKFLAWIPNINAIPVNVKLDKEKVGRVSLLSSDDNGENSGVVVLFDHAAIKEVLQ